MPVSQFACLWPQLSGFVYKPQTSPGYPLINPQTHTPDIQPRGQGQGLADERGGQRPIIGGGEAEGRGRGGVDDCKFSVPTKVQADIGNPTAYTYAISITHTTTGERRGGARAAAGGVGSVGSLVFLVAGAVGDGGVRMGLHVLMLVCVVIGRVTGPTMYCLFSFPL